jgi:hypothetical protein
LRIIAGWVTSIVFFAFGALAPSTPIGGDQISLFPSSVADRTEPFTLSQTVVFKHGDVSWLPELALAAGWPKKAIPKLEQIVLRESGGCPNRRGGDIVDKDCNITGVARWNHRSDTGLLQINGVNYDKSRNKWALVCREMNICTQEPLLDPLTNLKAGYLLYKVAGWGPWDPCAWGPEYAHRCKKKN